MGQNCLAQDGGSFCQKVLLPFIVITSLRLLFTWQNWSLLPLLSQVPVHSSPGMLTRWCCSQQCMWVALPTPRPFPFWPHCPHLLQHKFPEVKHGFLWLSTLLVQWIAPITHLVNFRFAHFHCFIFLHKSWTWTWMWSCSVMSVICDPMDCSLLVGSSIHGIFQARVLEWGAIAFSGSVTQSCPTLSDPMDCSTPGFPVHHQLPVFIQSQAHWVGDAIQPSHPLSSPSPPAFNLSQHQGLFQWVSSSHEVAKVLDFQLQHQSFQWIFRTDFL